MSIYLSISISIYIYSAPRCASYSSTDTRCALGLTPFTVHDLYIHTPIACVATRHWLRSSLSG